MNEKKSKLTLQINDLSALERLIGGDSEVEIDIRNSVVQKFAEKHLKSVANSGTLAQIFRNLETEIKNQTGLELSKSIATFNNYYGSTLFDVKLRPEVQAVITQHIRNETGKIIEAEADKILQTIKEEIDKRVEERTRYMSARYIDEEVKKRVAAAFANLK